MLGSGCLFPGLAVTSLIDQNIATIPFSFFIAGEHGSLYSNPAYLALN